LPISVEFPNRIIKGVPGKKIRLNIQVEHPRGNWKNIGVSVDFSDSFALPSIQREIKSNEVGFSTIQVDIEVPPERPSERTELRIGSITVTRDGDKTTELLPKLIILTPEAYFEEIIGETLRSLGYDVQRYGGPRNPDLVAYHPDQPGKLEVEATTESSYDLVKYRSDIGKFHGLKHVHNFQRLLIVTKNDRIEPGVLDDLAHVHQPFTLIRYRDLQNLLSRYKNCQISKYEVINKLTQPGVVEVS
jgi:hypothetical protein